MSGWIYGILLLCLVVSVIIVVLKINFNIPNSVSGDAVTVIKKIKARVYPPQSPMWIYLHAVFYFILGNLIPGQWWFIVFTIIVWESFERIASSKQVWFKENFWKKTMYDIIVDVVAYYLGTQFC